jgi:hypothetical protein
MTTPANLFAAKSTEDHRGSIPTDPGRPPRAGRARRLDCGRDLRRLTLARRFAGRRPDEAERGRARFPTPTLHAVYRLAPGRGATGRHRRRPGRRRTTPDPTVRPRGTEPPNRAGALADARRRAERRPRPAKRRECPIDESAPQGSFTKQNFYADAKLTDQANCVYLSVDTQRAGLGRRQIEREDGRWSPNLLMAPFRRRSRRDRRTTGSAPTSPGRVKWQSVPVPNVPAATSAGASAGRGSRSSTRGQSRRSRRPGAKTRVWTWRRPRRC